MTEFILLIVVFILLLTVWQLHRFLRPRLNAEDLQEAINSIRQTESLHPEHAIIKMHKTFIAVLNDPKHPKKAVEVMRKYDKQFKQPKTLWHLHRLRNQIAHDNHPKVTDKEAEKARKTMVGALQDLM
jgi:uncharacterized protein YifE (UPF0438 family)